MRLKSTAVWYDLPGVEAAYMPIGAPSAVDALMNVGHTDALGNHRMAGRYTAMPGVAPTWDAATGWTLNGTTQYLDTGVLMKDESTALFRFSGAVRQYIGTYKAGSEFVFTPMRGEGDNLRIYNHALFKTIAPGKPTCVMGMAGINCYLDGELDTTTAGWTGGSNANTFYIGARNGAMVYYEGKILAGLLASRTLTSAEMWLASRQMAYCEQNPDWNAWSRRRRYYYAPSAAAFQAAWAARTNRLIGGGL